MDERAYCVEEKYVEEISYFHAVCYKVMVYALLVISIIHTINAVVCKIKETKIVKNEIFYIQNLENTDNTDDKIEDMPVIVAFTPVVVTALGTLCMYEFVFFICLISFISAFALPVCIWCLFVVAKWEKEKKS